MATNRAVRGRLIAAFAALCLAGGCNSPQGPATASNDGADNDVSVDASPPRGGGASGGGTRLTGIVYSSCQADGYRLTSVDPATGARTGSRVFPIQPASMSVAMDCSASVPGGFAVRQMFDRDFNRMAVSRQTGQDEVHIGYVDTSGDFTDLSPADTGYGGTRPHYVGGVFGPIDGRIWFESPSNLGSVDPDGGPASLKMARSAGFASSLGDFQSLFWFSPDGKRPDSGIAYASYSPDGKTRINYTGSGFEIGPEFGDAVTVVSGPQLCWPKQFVDNSRFLCIAAGGAHQVYLMTLNTKRTKLTQKPLLPASDKTVTDVLPSPDGTSMAFIGDGVLYTTPLSGGAEPHQVGDGSSGGLLAWVR